MGKFLRYMKMKAQKLYMLCNNKHKICKTMDISVTEDWALSCFIAAEPPRRTKAGEASLDVPLGGPWHCSSFSRTVREKADT